MNRDKFPDQEFKSSGSLIYVCEVELYNVLVFLQYLFVAIAIVFIEL